MTDAVQHLIDRVKQQAIAAAETESRAILSTARQQAEGTLGDAVQRAKTIVHEAEGQARQLLDNGEKTLRQAARDLLLHVGAGIERVVERLIATEVSGVFSEPFVEQMLERVLDKYLEQGIDGQIDVHVPKQDSDQLVAFVRSRLRQELERGVEVHLDTELGRGFKISLSGGRVVHDFSAAACAQVLAALVRPQLGALVHAAAREATETKRS